MPGHRRNYRHFAVTLIVSTAVTACTGPNTPTPPETIFVSGSVLLLGGAPLPDAQVYLHDASGLKDPVETDAAGIFQFADVATPYSLSVVPPAGSDLTPITWAGIDRPNPKLVLEVETSGALPEPCPSGTGRVAGFLNPPVGPTNTAEVFFISKALTRLGVAFGVDERGPGAATYEILPFFDGTTCQAGALGTILFVERNASGDIAAMAVVDGVFVANDDTVTTSLDLSPGAAQMAILSGTVELPPGVDEAEVAPAIRIDDAYAVMEGTVVSSASPDFALKVPLVAGAQYRVNATKSTLGSNLRWAWSGLVTAPATGISLSLPAISDLHSPSGPVADPSPTFTYSEVDSMDLYGVLVIDGVAFAHLAMGDGTEVTIPQLGAPAQLSGDLTWGLAGIDTRDADSADDLLDGRMIDGVYQSSFPQWEPDFVRGGFVNADLLSFSLP